MCSVNVLVATPTLSSRGVAWLTTLFFFSGAAAVGMEVVWARVLHRAFGSTAMAVAVVLSGVLGGLGLGALIAEKLSPRVAHPLRAYAAMEFLAAVCGLLGTLILREGTPALRYGGGPLLLLGVVVVCALPIGATFPFGVYALLGGEHLSSRLRRLYGFNALGGSAGGAMAALIGLSFVGEWATVAAAAVLQVVVAISALILARGVARRGVGHSDRVLEGVPEATHSTAAVALFVFLSGFLVFYWEVLWSRLLALTVGATAYAFAIVSSSVILGIAIGSFVFGGRLLATHGGWVLPLSVATLFGGGYFAVPYLADAYLAGVRTLGAHPLVWGCLGAAAIAFVPNMLLGGLFPWVVSRRAALVGRLYFVNSLGSCLGAFLGGPLGATLFSLAESYRLGVAGLAALAVPGVWLALRPPSSASSGGGARGFVLGALTLAALGVGHVVTGLLLNSPWEERRVLSGVYQWARADMDSVTLDDRLASREIVSITEGREVTVSVELERDSNTLYVRGNGKVEGSVPLDPAQPSLADLPTQLLLGEIPRRLLLRKVAPRALLIGLGSGVTLGALTDGPPAGEIEVDVIEIERAFYESLRSPEARAYLEPFVPSWLLHGDENADPSVALHFGDARRLLKVELADRRWDAIISQPSEPWIPAAAALFTREFFEEAARHLAEDGFFVQWLQLYKVEPANLKILLRTFHRVFPRVYLFRPPATGELVVLGSRVSLPLESLLHAGLDPGLPLTGLVMPIDRLAIFLGGTRAIAAWADMSPGLAVHTDDRSDLVFRLARSLYSSKDLARDNLRQLRELGGRDPVTRYLPQSLRGDPAFLRLLAERNVYFGDFSEALSLIRDDSSAEAQRLRELCDE